MDEPVLPSCVNEFFMLSNLPLPSRLQEHHGGIIADESGILKWTVSEQKCSLPLKGAI